MIFPTNSAQIAPNVSTVYDVLAARTRALRSLPGRKAMGEKRRFTAEDFKHDKIKRPVYDVFSFFTIIVSLLL
jgi:hypothetical protein